MRHIDRLFGPTADKTETHIIANRGTYYFHVRNGKDYPDETGKVFQSQQEALAHAAILAAELAQDGDWDGFVVSITDADGNVIAQVPVAE